MVKFTKTGYEFFHTWSYFLAANAKSVPSRLLCVSLFFFLLLPGISVGQSPIGKGPGVAGDFEIDANFVVNSLAPKDWRSVFQADQAHPPYVTKVPVSGENAQWIVDGNSGIGTEEQVFRGTSNKNGDFINAGGSPYLIETSSPSTPQKNDITNVYARATVVNNKQWIMLGAETRSVDGTSYLDFEYNKKGAHTTATNLIGDGTEGGRTARAGTVAGDVLFVVDFSKGGNVPIPRLFEWQATGKTKPAYDWVELPIAANDARIFIVTNGADVETLGFNSGFAGNGTPSSTTLALQFVEIGVNLTDFGLNDNVCSPNATLTCKTRTSSSYTSELKDFSIFKFSVVPAATITDPDNQTVCPDANASFATTVSGAGASASNVTWYKVTGTSPDEVETQIIDNDTKYDIVVSNSTSTLTIKNVVAADAGKYRAKLSGATCGTPSQDATLAVKVAATLTDLGVQSKCPGQDAIFSTTVSGDGASASNVQWFFGSSTTPLLNDGTNYVIAVSGNTSTLTVKTVAADDAGTYTAKLTGADCGSPEKSQQLSVKAQPDQKDGVIQPITCTDRGFSLKINSPQQDVIYTVTQPCNSAYSSTGTLDNGSLLYTNLKFAAGYKIVASQEGCVSEFVCAGTCSDICATPAASTNNSRIGKTDVVEAKIQSASPTKVLAAPNPFNDKIRFSLQSDVSGRGTLELYNMLGQRVKVLYQGEIQKGVVKTIEYSVPGTQRANLIYVFRVGDQKITGKLISLK